MKCEEARPLLVARVHGDLAPSEEPAVRAHLAACSPCRAAEFDFHQLKVLLRAVGHREANRWPHLWERAQILKAKLQVLFEGEIPRPGDDALAPHRPRRDRALQRVLLLAAALAAAAIVAIFFRRSEV